MQPSRAYLFYGPSGTGKTTLASTFPKPLLYIDVKDEGLDSIHDVEGIDVLEVESFEDIEEWYWELKQDLRGYKTIVIDTITMLQTMLVKEFTEKNSKNTMKAGSWGTLKQRDWGDIASILKYWLVNFRDFVHDDVEVVFLAQDRTFNMSEEAEDNVELLAPTIGPAVSPSIASAVNAAVSVIGNTYLRELRVKKTIDGRKKTVTKIEYSLGLGPHPLYTRKVRKPKSTALPDSISDPHYEDIISLIEGE